MQGGKNSRKGKERNKYIIHITVQKFKNEIIKQRKEKEERRKIKKEEHSTKLQKPNVEADIYNNNKKCD